MQWADELSLGFLMYLARLGALEDLSMLIIGTFRTEEITSNLRRLLNTDSIHSINLDRLDLPAVRKIMADMMAVKVPPESFVSFLYDFSDGNPFFVAEYLRACVDEGLLFRDEMSRWQIMHQEDDDATTVEIRTLPLPRSLRDLVDRRLALLSKTARNLAWAAAVIGRQIEAMVLWNLVTFNSTVLDAVDELINRQVLDEIEPGIYRFSHDIIQHVIYDKIPQQEKSGLHQKAAETLETMKAEQKEDLLASIGLHWEQAGESDKAKSYYFKAAKRAVQRYAISDADQLFNSYFNLSTTADVDRIKARNFYGSNVLIISGRIQEAVEQHQQAILESEALENWECSAVSMLGLIVAQNIRGAYPEAKALCKKVMSLAIENNDRFIKAQALIALGSIYLMQALPTKARELYIRARRIFRNLQKEDGEAKVLSCLGTMSMHSGNLDKAYKYFKRAMMKYHKLGIRHMEADNRKNLAMVHWMRGQLKDAERLGQDAIHLMREIGDRYREGVALGNLAVINQEMGRLSAALSIYRQALEIQHEIGDRFAEGNTLGNTAHVEYEMGHVDHAEVLFNRSIAILDELGARGSQARMRHGLAVLERQTLGNYERAEYLLRQAENVFRETGDFICIAFCFCERGHLTLARGQDALDYFNEARNLAMSNNLESDSEFAKALAILENAIEAQSHGETLFRGQKLVDYPTGIRQWLESNNELGNDESE